MNPISHTHTGRKVPKGRDTLSNLLHLNQDWASVAAEPTRTVTDFGLSDSFLPADKRCQTMIMEPREGEGGE